MNQKNSNNYQNPAKTLSKTLLFRLSSLAFIVYMTPFLAVIGRGLIILLFILYLAILAGLMEKSFGRVLNLLFKGISNNKLLLIFVIWYAVGSILYTINASGLHDWRLMVSPVLIILGMCFSFAFMHDRSCHRFFIILFIIFSGIQALFSVNILASTVNIARLMWVETRGAWIYGNQITYAIYVVVIPVLFFYAFKETGILKLVLVTSCFLILIESLISSFGTPLGLVFIGVVAISVLAIFILFKSNHKFRNLMIISSIIALVVFGYQHTYDNPIYASAYSRVIAVINDPTSGGYLPNSGGHSRWDIAQISIKSFLSAPLFGVGGLTENNYLVGGHSSFVDNLGIYGLLGGGGALFGVIAVISSEVGIQFWHRHDWETLLAFATVILLVIVGVVNPYWEATIPLTLTIVYPFLNESRE